MLGRQILTTHLSESDHFLLLNRSNLKRLKKLKKLKRNGPHRQHRAAHRVLLAVPNHLLLLSQFKP